MGGISSNLATSFMTLIDVKPCCLCPRSSNGMTAAFLYCGGYRAKISVMSFSFCGVNLKGMEALFSGVSRCWYVRLAVTAFKEQLEDEVPLVAHHCFAYCWL